MRYTNKGRVRVPVTSVQHGADEGVTVWHGANKLWPPATPTTIRAVTINPESYVVISDVTYKPYWNFCAAAHVLASGKGTVTLGGVPVQLVDGYTYYFSERQAYSDGGFAVGSNVNGVCVVTADEESVLFDTEKNTDEGYVTEGEYETDIPFSDFSVLNFDSVSAKTTSNPGKHMYNIEIGLKKDGEVVYKKVTTPYVIHSKTFHATYSIFDMLGGASAVRTLMATYKNPDTFYVKVIYSKTKRAYNCKATYVYDSSSASKKVSIGGTVTRLVI